MLCVLLSFVLDLLNLVLRWFAALVCVAMVVFWGLVFGLCSSADFWML